MPPSHTQRHSAVTGRRRDYRIRTDYIGLHDITTVFQAQAVAGFWFLTAILLYDEKVDPLS